MNEFPFSECRKSFDIAEGFSDDNLIVTDKTLDALPRVRFQRHGSTDVDVSGCRFDIHSTAKGNMVIFVAHSASVVKIGAHTRLNADIRLWRSPRVVIEDHTTINRARLVADNSEIHIGRDCMFSDDVLIQSSDQHGLIDLDTLRFSNADRRSIRIGEHVWVGRRTVVMPNVEIGDGAVIGTGSIVTRNAAACTYNVGVPAREVRNRASWTRLPERANERESQFFERMRSALVTGPESKEAS